jgi:hypothetical protein
LGSTAGRVSIGPAACDHIGADGKQNNGSKCLADHWSYAESRRAGLGLDERYGAAPPDSLTVRLSHWY